MCSYKSHNQIYNNFANGWKAKVAKAIGKGLLKGFLKIGLRAVALPLVVVV